MNNHKYNWFYNPILLLALTLFGIVSISSFQVLFIFFNVFGIFISLVGILFLGWAVIGCVCYIADVISAYKKMQDCFKILFAMFFSCLIGRIIFLWWGWFSTRDFSLL